VLSLFPRARLATRLEEHYGLAQRPFALTLDQQFVYQSRSYAEAVRDVRRALDRRDGLVIVTGDTGTGKTMLCRTLVAPHRAGVRGGDPAQQLDGMACVSLVLDPRVTVEDLLRHVLADFGVFVSSGRPDPCGPGGEPPSRHQLMRALQRLLATLVPTGACAVLIVDEAQHLDRDVLQQLCLLLNLETNESKLLQVVLVGHTSLNDVIEAPALAQLNQRVARRCALEPLSAREVGAYMQHRLATAQRLALAADLHTLGTGEATVEVMPCNLSFTPAAVRAVVRHSRGIPRVVNLLCDRALEIGYERRVHVIRGWIVRAAARRVAGRTAGLWGEPFRLASRTRRVRATRAKFPLVRPAAVAAIVAVGALGAGAGAWQAGRVQGGPGLPPPPATFAAAGTWIARPDMGRIEVFDRLEIWTGALTREPTDAVVPADPRLLGVALLRRGDVVSLALEMSAEPRKAVLQTLSDRILELDMGPVVGPVRSEELAPASEVPLVSQLSIREERTPANEVYVRTRVMLRAPGRGDVRVAGRVVYVDVQPVPGSR